MLRIGRIAYANCTPVFHGLASRLAGEDYHFSEGVPSALNAKLAAGEIDICPSSSIEYARNPGRYLIIPDLSISSEGPVGSVLLFSRQPIEMLDGQTILLSSESATSVNLLKILVNNRFRCRCSFSVTDLPLEEGLKVAPAMLLIGDAALRECLKDRDGHLYDLGRLWNDWTGLPFVFALWFCARDVAERQHDEVVRLARYLMASKVHNEETYRQLARVAPEAAWMGEDKLVTYWMHNISYDLEQRHIDGLKLFFRYCAELGLLENEPELHFLDLP